MEQVRPLSLGNPLGNAVTDPLGDAVGNPVTDPLAHLLRHSVGQLRKETTMTTSKNDATDQFTGIDITSQYPEVDVTSTLPTSSEPTLETPSSDPLAVFRENEGATASGSRTAFDPASTGETAPTSAATPSGPSVYEAGAGSRSQAPSGAPTGAPGATPGGNGAQTWSAPASPTNYHDLPEAPSRGVRVGAFVWSILVCMVGAFLIAEAYITTFNLPVLGISAIAALGIILILTAIFSGRSKKKTPGTEAAGTTK